ncbi:origin recognition complex subunit 4 NDAI_0J00410 [Naumovozyma dairenensis CBS 421]|uniref:Origin recognition complex subunit 4 C-terminal domain-containing protein n=1 Tax=Naumovozyma dairenensis (strain ATCC 10597 / BCRC 20456 / CBS 421 / NBRC 0211 / NRRL Y-12639) TaxID=1071378 RepID=G0WGK5_NAUDC|nr:hypothetical protein NDAI_0J00410 [Naumovozyma dairenensis CBS 421]CCD26933.1 hypothetical protein NDAI_0J00410 [Naumovozyma dairenensis CBS 421]
MTATESKNIFNSANAVQNNEISRDNNVLSNVKLVPIKRPLEPATPSKNSPRKRKIQSPYKKVRLLTEKTLLQGAESPTERPIKKTLIDLQFANFKKHLLSHIYQTLPVEQITVYPFLNNVQQEIDRILRQSVIQKESNSAILVGPRKSFKSFLLNYELNLLSQNYDQQFITIRLNGFIHSELTAINSIAIQLEKQLEKIHGKRPSDKKVSISGGSNTEVFERILRLLDSASISDVSTDDKTRKGDDNKITVVFIFDEIDTFAGPVRQTLLYNLFDMVEHARVPVCIFGSTTKLNILEYLEKRVKSRFSQRIIYMPQFQNMNDFRKNTEHMLTLNDDNNTSGLGFDKDLETEWNNLISYELQNESSKLFHALKTNYETFMSLDYLKNAIIPIISRSTSLQSLKDSMISCKGIVEYNTNQLEDSLTSMVQSLSDLELAILLSAARVSSKKKPSLFNYNLCYSEYEAMIKSMNARIPTVASTPGGAASVNSSPTKRIVDNTIKQWNKQDVRNVWESLANMKLLTEAGATGLKESATSVANANYNNLQGTTVIPFDLRKFQVQIDLQELRRIVPRSSMYYSWTQL